MMDFHYSKYKTFDEVCGHRFNPIRNLLRRGLIKNHSVGEYSFETNIFTHIESVICLSEKGKNYLLLYPIEPDNINNKNS